MEELSTQKFYFLDYEKRKFWRKSSWDSKVLTHNLGGFNEEGDFNCTNGYSNTHNIVGTGTYAKI